MTFYIGLVALFACVAYSRMLGERALRELTPEQKVRLLDGFSSMRMYSVIPLGILVLTFLGLPKLLPAQRIYLLLGGLVFFLGYMLILQIIVARKLRTLDLPDQYCRQVILSRTISLIGMALFFAGVAYEYFQRQQQ